MLVALTIAGSDSVGGAGIEADVKSMAAQGIHAAVAVTAITAQNTTRVAGIFPLPATEVVAQIDAVLEDVHVSAAKTGMLYSAGIATAIADRLSGENIPLVIDPVLVAGVGDALNRDDLIEALREHVIPLATIVTPNVPEAEALVGYKIEDDATVRRACRDLAGMGAEAVLLKGGHMKTAECTDTLFHDGKFLLLSGPRVDVRGHGGGCILSSYLAANLAKGSSVWESALASRAAIGDAIIARHVIGRGVPIVEPLGRQLRDAQRFQALSRLRSAAGEAAMAGPSGWLLGENLSMAFALSGAEGAEDVCAVAVPSGQGIACPCPSFGTARGLGLAILAAMKVDGRMRAGAELPFSEELAKAVRKTKLSSRTIRDGHRSSLESGMGPEDGLMLLDCVPDVVVDRGGPGRGPAIRLFASSPEELLGKLRTMTR
ncbi:MAG: bifunctional hydroxymethylpyrimidine kinase/phosphomethylpyrimidine kinase [Methanomassiliicoccus sp.]|nr:bifunctional hydroxymethylpyrimidine kinase/phosphomethylpyrimidine kinase [Methanomassiliicoccus sp.]